MYDLNLEGYSGYVIDAIHLLRLQRQWDSKS